MEWPGCGTKLEEFEGRGQTEEGRPGAGRLTRTSLVGESPGSDETRPSPLFPTVTFQEESAVLNFVVGLN